MSDPLKKFQENKYLVYGALKRYKPAYLFDEDIIQEGMIGLWKACMAYDESKAAFSTLAYRCILNQINMALRKTRPSTVSLEEPIGDGLTIGDTLADKTFSFGLVELELDKAISHLTPIQRKVLELQQDGLNQKQIAQATGYSQSYVSRIAKRALSILARYV